MTNRWLLLNFDALGALSVLVTTLFSISTLTDEAGLAGLCITSAMAFTNSGKWLICYQRFDLLTNWRFKSIGLAGSGQVRLLRHRIKGLC